jgi:hypothetical protein
LPCFGFVVIFVAITVLLCIEPQSSKDERAVAEQSKREEELALEKPLAVE